LSVRSDNLAAYLFLLPYALLFVPFRIYPVFSGLVLSLYKRDILGLENQFVGLANFVTALKDNVFWLSLWNTVRYTLISTPIMVPAGLLLALALSRRSKSGAFFRVVFFTPRVVSVAVATLVWRWIYQAEFGLLNHYLSLLGLPEQNWLSSPVWSMFAIVVTDTWWVVGWPMIIFLAGLGQIDPELYEAARVDGASGSRSFWHITLPGLRPSLLFIIVTHLIGSLQIFGLIFIMTRGGPYGSTRVMVQYIYENGFEYYKMGYAAALSFLLMIVVLMATLLQFTILKPRE
jgi:multiple sugar transport system permease protein